MKPIVVILSAPSGSGKGTIARALAEDSRFAFSISATTRLPRGNEKDGIEYHFMTVDLFRSLVADAGFLEFEEVYPGKLYGTTKKEVEGIFKRGKNIIFDVDVAGGLSLKKYFGDQAISIFIKVPSLAVLKQRLVARATDSQADIDVRLAKAEEEIRLAPQFDYVLMNDDLDRAIEECREVVEKKMKGYNEQ